MGASVSGVLQLRRMKSRVRGNEGQRERDSRRAPRSWSCLPSCLLGLLSSGSLIKCWRGNWENLVGGRWKEE